MKNKLPAIISLILSIWFFSTEAQAISIAEHLTQRNHNITLYCGDSQSAYPCSGIILRGTASSKEFSLVAKSRFYQKRGRSFTYLRHDAKFRKMLLGYKNCFILHALLKAPRQAYKIKVLCLFPFNAQNNGRTMKGCGEHLKFHSESHPC